MFTVKVGHSFVVETDCWRICAKRLVKLTPERGKVQLGGGFVWPSGYHHHHRGDSRSPFSVFFVNIATHGKPPGLVVNAEDSRSEPWQMRVRIPASPKKTRWKKMAENIAKIIKQVTPKIF